jgi:hypothetical protein
MTSHGKEPDITVVAGASRRNLQGDGVFSDVTVTNAEPTAITDVRVSFYTSGPIPALVDEHSVPQVAGGESYRFTRQVDTSGSRSASLMVTTFIDEQGLRWRNETPPGSTERG